MSLLKFAGITDEIWQLFVTIAWIYGSYFYL